ncbi:hypothetical protein [Pararhizobium sp. PWRC1-1]|uniref:hypothetical protein n=1 Tax=Pararhizobium sp. PWRC1-1 TaxID=2804566 RepID=UPI003CEA35A3
MSAASVAVIYAYRQETARAEWKIFLIFFAKSHDRRLSPDKSDVENRQGHDEQQRGGVKSQNMVQEEVLAWVSGIFRGAFSDLWKQFDGCHGFVSKPA